MNDYRSTVISGFAGVVPNLSMTRSGEYTNHILSGLIYLHDRNTIHRNIKCANILVDASGVVELADFEMAKQTNKIGPVEVIHG
jgi:serine/threonine protein kinase